MENTYLEKRKELEDKINLITIKSRRSPSRGMIVITERLKLQEELAELDAVEMQKCKEDAHYFATTYMLMGDKPYVTILSKEEFNRQIRPTEQDINKWFLIRRDRPSVGNETFKLKVSKGWFGIEKE